MRLFRESATRNRINQAECNPYKEFNLLIYKDNILILFRGFVLGRGAV
jgi:hypothetical protein